MPRQDFIARIKGRIDRGEIKKESELSTPLDFANADDEERRILTEYLFSKYPKPGGGAGPVFKGLFTAADIQGDQLGKAPFSNQAIPVDEFGVRYWFEYFWQEAKMSNDEAGRKAMADICNELFEKTPSGPHQYKVRDKYKDDDSGTANPDDWRRMMTTLLHIGFRRVDPANGVAPSQAPRAMSPSNPAAHHTMLRANFTPLLPDQFTADTEIFWRSESRTIDRIVSQGGTTRQCDVNSLAADMNINKPWHPFSDPATSAYMWYRNGQNDNDYYTVISVATNFETALGFPKIDEARVYGFPKKPLEQWTRDEVQLHRANLALVTLNSGERRVMLATRTTAYMCVICGRIIDTKAAGGGFPEKGVFGIPLDQIFAYLPITRIHHGPDPADGFTAFPDCDKGNLLTGSFSKSKDLFGNIYEKCCDEYFKAKYSAPIASAWTSSGPAAPKIKVPVSRILEFPIGAAEFEAFKRGRQTGNVGPKDFIRGAGLNVRNVLKKA